MTSFTTVPEHYDSMALVREIQTEILGDAFSPIRISDDQLAILKSKPSSVPEQSIEAPNTSLETGRLSWRERTKNRLEQVRYLPYMLVSNAFNKDYAVAEPDPETNKKRRLLVAGAIGAVAAGTVIAAVSGHSGQIEKYAPTTVAMAVPGRFRRKPKPGARAAMTEEQRIQQGQKERRRKRVIAAGAVLVAAGLVSYLAYKSGWLDGLGFKDEPDLSDVSPDHTNKAPEGHEHYGPYSELPPDEKHVSGQGTGGATAGEPPNRTHLPTPAAGGRTFEVEPGHGITHEIMDYAEAHGQHVTPVQAYREYLDLHSEYGRHIIDLNGPGNNTYLSGGDVRLSHPGRAHWYPGIVEDLRHFLKSSAKG
jgi:hypothetical protein